MRHPHDPCSELAREAQRVEGDKRRVSKPMQHRRAHARDAQGVERVPEASGSRVRNRDHCNARRVKRQACGGTLPSNKNYCCAHRTGIYHLYGGLLPYPPYTGSSRPAPQDPKAKQTKTLQLLTLSHIKQINRCPP